LLSDSIPNFLTGVALWGSCKNKLLSMTSKEKIEYNKVDPDKHRLQKKQRKEKSKLRWLCSLHSLDDHSPISASNKKTFIKINNQRERERKRVLIYLAVYVYLSCWSL
jgi:hypothetical protein